MYQDRISLLHGAGGELMQELVESLVDDIPLDDGFVLDLDINNGEEKLVFTTDSYVVDPIFFPGGDIGKMAVAGTVNDLAAMGARPLYMLTSIVLETGLKMSDLRRIYRSIHTELDRVGCRLVGGDTKVLNKGDLDKVIINTSGIGVASNPVFDSGLSPGDLIIVSGTVGDHGMTILSHREGLEFDPPLESDCCSLWDLVEAALGVGGITAMKDPTRGGLSNCLNEMAEKSGIQIVLEEEKIPIGQSVSSACRVLGIDPFEVANEGKMVIGVKKEKATEVLEAVKGIEMGKNAEIIGEIREGSRVILKTIVGGSRYLQRPIGDPVPRVC